MEEATWPDNKRRPRGAMRAAIFVRVDGAPPSDEKQYTFITLSSPPAGGAVAAFRRRGGGSTPYVARVRGTDAGKMAHYMLRWRMRDGSTGAWAETISATITG